MTGNYNILRLLKEILKNKNKLQEEYSNLDEIISSINTILETKEDFNSAYLLNYLYQNISSKEVAKRKTTARDLEDYLAILFNGIVTDELKRENKDIKISQIENDFITNFTISNKREKVDIVFADDFAISVKTLMPDNYEINLGSFEKTALFYELDVYDFLGERKGKDGRVFGETVKIGLGSRTLLKKLLLLIKEKGKYEVFKSRFLKMTKEIFFDDMIIAIKNDRIMEFYFIKSLDFYKLFEKNIEDIDNFMNLVNRWEGNSIRVNREEFLKIATCIKIDFSFLENSILKYFNEFETKTTNILIKYINDIENKEQYRQEMFLEIENVINLIEARVKGEKQ